MKRAGWLRTLVMGAACVWVSTAALAQERFIVLASTTSTEQSGLFGHLLPRFKQAHGIDVRVVAVGSGQAIDMARRGDADVVLVHDKAAEEQMVAEGFSVARKEVMYNDFVLIGPADDPAKVQGRDISTALSRVVSHSAVFISRADRSGTHAAELRLWQRLGTDPSKTKPAGYRECGCGMGPALNMASSLKAYVLADRGTWLAFKNRGQLKILVEGDATLQNPYGVLVVNPAKHPHVRHASAQLWAQWLTSPAGQAAIASFKVGGQTPFFPNAKP